MIIYKRINKIRKKMSLFIFKQMNVSFVYKLYNYK